MSKKEEQYEKRKWQILDIALNHFIQYGYHGHPPEIAEIRDNQGLFSLFSQ